MNWVHRTLFLLFRLFLTAGFRTGQSLTPQNLSLVWINDFKPKLTWAPPVGTSQNCTYEVLYHRPGDSRKDNVSSPSWSEPLLMNGGSIHFAVSSFCPDRGSEPAVLNVSYPEMVKTVSCSTISSKEVRCSWVPARPETLVNFFYELGCQNPKVCGSSVPHLRECSSYGWADGGVRTCTLQAALDYSLSVLFNGTAEGAFFRNTFHARPQDKIQPPGFNWTISKTKGKFNITWNTPNITRWLLKFEINYTECTENKKLDIHEKTRTTAQLDTLPRCSYRVKMRAAYMRFGEFYTPWTHEETFDADTDQNAWVYPVILFPLLFGGLLALLVICSRKHGPSIFPEIPKPRDLLSDISDNNNKGTTYTLCSPYEEEEICDITLVVDPQNSKPKPDL